MAQYEKIKVLGKGAYGAAFLALRRSDHEPVVLKQISVRATEQKEAAEREVLILSKLDHRHIIRYLDSGTFDGQLWIAMELARDGDLFQLVDNLRSSRPPRFLIETQFKGMFVQMCLALTYLHGQHILHRDLKSKNVFLAGHRNVENTDVQVIKLGDFGISKVLDNTFALAQTQIGTPYYLSPEICRDEPYGVKSDVWAAGCLLFEMICLQVPFSGRDLRSLAHQILNAPTPPLPTEHQMNRPLAVLVGQLLSKRSDDRPTMEALCRHRYLFVLLFA